jgi:ABC-type dipeptide/oligopeptide/nickel transport system permease subunit
MTPCAIAATSAGEVAPATTAPGAWQRLARNAVVVASAITLFAIVLAAVTAPSLAPHDPGRQSLLRRYTPPAWLAGGRVEYPLGTDHIGRDVLSRIVHGARVSLLVGISAVLLASSIGVSLGLVSGFVSGRVDTVIMTIVDVMLSFPGLLLALAFAAALGPSLATVILVLGLTGWERYTRVVRAEVLALRERDFVEAARALGARSARIALRHVLPNTLSSVIVLATLQVAQAILQEAALSFLGVGTGTAYPTWGQMIAQGRDVVTIAWWLPTFPGLAILVTVLSINLIGDRLRDALDPRAT